MQSPSSPSDRTGSSVPPRSFTPAFPLLSLYDPIVRILSRDRVWRAALLKRLAPRPGELIVDAGCGTATFLQAIGKQVPDAVLIGVDPDDRILNRARDKLADTDIMVELLQGYLHDLDRLLHGRGITKITSSLVFHQVPLAEKRAGLAAMFSALASKGVVLIADYGLQRSRAMRTLFRLVQYVDGFADTQPNADGVLPMLMREAGFTDVAETDVFATATGSISIYRGFKPA